MNILTEEQSGIKAKQLLKEWWEGDLPGFSDEMMQQFLVLLKKMQDAGVMEKHMLEALKWIRDNSHLEGMTWEEFDKKSLINFEDMKTFFRN